MSERPTVTERQAVERERAAWVEGFLCGADNHSATVRSIALGAAVRHYPLPKITRPRVVADEFGVQWKVVDGEVVLHANGDDGGIDVNDYNTTTKRILLWADLLNNPTEEVEE